MTPEELDGVNAMMRKIATLEYALKRLLEAAKPVMTMEEWDKGYLGEIADDLGKAIIAAEEALK